MKQNLVKTAAGQSPANGAADQSSLTAMSLDLIALTLPYLSSVDAMSLFNLCLSSEILESKENAVQKRGYKILGKLMESSKVQIDAIAVLQQLDNFLDDLLPAAKKVRSYFSFRSFRTETAI